MHKEFLSQFCIAYRRYVPLFCRKIVFFLRFLPSNLLINYYIYFYNLHIKNKINTIVLLRLDGIGDMVLWLDAAKEFKKFYNDYRIILICSENSAPLATLSGCFDVVFPICTKYMRSCSPFTKVKLRKELALLQAEKLIQCSPNYVGQIEFIVASIAAKEKITIDYDKTGNCNPAIKNMVFWSSRVYDKVIYTPMQVMHELQRNKEFFKGLGHNYITSFPSLPKHFLCESILETMEYCVIFPGASIEYRRWNDKQFAEVVDFLLENGRACILCGGKDDIAISNNIKKKCSSNNKGKLLDFTGKTSLLDLLNIISKSDFVLSNDTSAVHLAVAVQVQAICILGPWELGRIYPYTADNVMSGKQPILCYHDMPCSQCYRELSSKCKRNLRRNGRWLCIEEVKVEDVIEVVKRYI